MSVLKWIWGLMRKSMSWWISVMQLLIETLAQPITWLFGAVVWLANFVWDWFSGLLSQAVSWVTGSEIPELSVSIPLASYVLREWLCIDVLIECFGTFLLVWIAAKSARLLMVPLRAILELL